MSDCSEPKYSPAQLKGVGFLRRLQITNLKAAQSFAGIFEVLQESNSWSWFQFDVLKKIIKFMSKSTDDLIQNDLQLYKESFNEYCSSRRLYECPKKFSEANRELHRLLIAEFPTNISTKTDLQHLKKDFEMELRGILGIRKEDLDLLTYKNSATILIYSLPRAVADKVFQIPLSPEQEEMLVKIGLSKCYLYPEPTNQVRCI